MNSTLILSVQGTWYSRSEQTWAPSLKQARLLPQSRILSDFDNAPCGVMMVDSRPDFAAAVIEKQLRSEGLVDGEAHVLTHRILSAGGGCRVFYTAVPIAVWQATFAWLQGQASVGLLFSVESAMLALAQRHDAVLCRIGRQFRFLVAQAGTLIYLSSTAFSDDPDDIETALLNLTDQARAQWQPRQAKMSVYWCDLVAPQAEAGTPLQARLGERLGVNIEVAPVTQMTSARGELRTAADVMLQAVSWRAAANSWIDRMTAATERLSTPIAAVAAAFGVGLLAVAGFWATETMQLTAQRARLQEGAASITQLSADLAVPAATLLAHDGETLGFLGALAEAAESPDLLGFLADLRQAANQRVRLMRVRLQAGDTAFRIEGLPHSDAASERELSGFLAALRATGYQVKAEDPGYQAQQPGFFSYSVRRTAPPVQAKS